MLNQTSPMEHLAAFALCWAFGMVSCAVGQMAWKHARHHRSPP